MTLSEKQQAFTKILGEFLVWLYAQDGYAVTVGEALRTPEQQKIYFDSGKSKTMNSMHLKKLAVDLNLFIDGVYMTDGEQYKLLHDMWEELCKKYEVETKRIEWDLNHFQVSDE